MPTGIRKRRCFVVVAFLGAAAIGIGVGLLVGYVLGRLHRGEGPPKPLPVRVERVGPDEMDAGRRKAPFGALFVSSAYSRRRPSFRCFEL
jgi:hypothetical protein